MSISRIAEGFFRKCGVSRQGWPLCDVIFIKFFEKVAKSYLVGKAFILYASWWEIEFPFCSLISLFSFVVCLCLNDLKGLISLIIDLYVGSDKTKVSLEKCKNIFTSILLNSSITSPEYVFLFSFPHSWQSYTRYTFDICRLYRRQESIARNFGQRLARFRWSFYWTFKNFPLPHSPKSHLAR